MHILLGVAVAPVNFLQFNTAEDVANDNYYNVIQERQNLLHDSNADLTDSETTHDTPTTNMQHEDETTPSAQTTPSLSTTQSPISTVASSAAGQQGSASSPSTPVSAPRTHPGIECDFVSNFSKFFGASSSLLMLVSRFLV